MVSCKSEGGEAYFAQEFTKRSKGLTTDHVQHLSLGDTQQTCQTDCCGASLTENTLFIRVDGPVIFVRADAISDTSENENEDHCCRPHSP